LGITTFAGFCIGITCSTDALVFLNATPTFLATFALFGPLTFAIIVWVSHGDNDHFGGFKGLSQNLPVKKAFLTPGFFPKAFDGFLYQGQKKSL
jgi:hypothetical protein